MDNHLYICPITIKNKHTMKTITIATRTVDTVIDDNYFPVTLTKKQLSEGLTDDIHKMYYIVSDYNQTIKLVLLDKNLLDVETLSSRRFRDDFNGEFTITAKQWNQFEKAKEIIRKKSLRFVKNNKQSK